VRRKLLLARFHGVRLAMLKQIGTGAAFVALTVASGLVTTAIGAHARRPAETASPTQLASGTPFGAICRTSESGDARPDAAWVQTSFAHDSCSAPPMPAPVDGYTASREQIVAAMAATKRYATASDDFQRCVSEFLLARKAQNEREEKPVDEMLVILENQRIVASERSKRRNAEQVRFAIHSFNEYGSDCPD
jgi:hypothetical protein